MDCRVPLRPPTELRLRTTSLEIKYTQRSLFEWHPRVGGEGGVLPENLGRDVRPASQNPYPIYDQNLRFSLPYLWPDQKFETLFMTWLLDH